MVPQQRSFMMHPTTSLVCLSSINIPLNPSTNKLIDIGMAAFSLLTNRISNSTAKGVARLITANFGIMRHVEPIHDIRNLPIAILLVLAFVSAVSVAIIYPGVSDL
jgi:hypothetical protein